jgi:hypothetical protein
MRGKGSSDAEQGFDRRALEYQIGPGDGNRHAIVRRHHGGGRIAAI